VRNLEHDDSDAAIVSAISVLGSRLGLRVLAEGVERSSQLDLLTAEGCHEIQGFYFSPPMEPEKISKLLLEGSDSICPCRIDN
jgi:EAL domain-containing protein (putative c-di-GMP-specific phosphodiesterase class I)